MVLIRAGAVNAGAHAPYAQAVFKLCPKSCMSILQMVAQALEPRALRPAFGRWHASCCTAIGIIAGEHAMKWITAIIKPFTLDDVREALAKPASRA
jgi:hypothetical protein